VRLAEAEPVDYGFDLPKIVVAPNAPRKPSVKSEAEVAAYSMERRRVKFWWT
jgi:hypothetical protein